jgi:hypothetical protein
MANYDRWLGGMRKLRHSIVSRIGSTRLKDMHKLVLPTITTSALKTYPIKLAA